MPGKLDAKNETPIAYEVHKLVGCGTDRMLTRIIRAITTTSRDGRRFGFPASICLHRYVTVPRFSFLQGTTAACFACTSIRIRTVLLLLVTAVLDAD